MTDTTQYPGLTIILLMVGMSTVDWMAECLFSLF